MNAKKEDGKGVFPAVAGEWRPTSLAVERALLRYSSSKRKARRRNSGAKDDLDLLGDFSEQLGANFG